MQSGVQGRECPQCGAMATNSGGHDMAHSATHTLYHGVSHASPVLLGMGLLSAGAAAIQRFRFECASCGHTFFARYGPGAYTKDTPQNEQEQAGYDHGHARESEINRESDGMEM